MRSTPHHTRPTSLAFVGCGAIIEQNYLPALSRAAGVSCDMLVDPNRPRVEELAARYGINATGASLDDVPSTVQGVVIAAPNDLHVAIVKQAFDRGFHVLCEKPLGRTRAEVQAMVYAATASRRTLYAAMVCRRFPSVAEVVDGRMVALVGELQGIEASYGFPLDWPVTSPGFYDKARSGGGALLDGGAHLIDALLHVLGHPPYEVAMYRDDGEGGVEAEAEGRALFFIDQRRVESVLRASRLRRLPNTIVLRGESASLTIPLLATETAVLSTPSGAWPVTRALAGTRPCFAEQLADFGRAMRGEPHTLPAGDTQLDAMGLIDACYAARAPLTFAWNA